MGHFKISVEQYRGTSYDIGYQQGEQMSKSLLDMFSKIVNEKDINLGKLRKIYASYAPHLFQELTGIADGMNISLQKATIFSGYGAPGIQGMGCSSVVNRHMLVRNYDFSPEMYDARFVFVQPVEGYASVGHSLHVMGRTEGVNEKGLAVALHFVNNKHTKIGLTADSVIRIILDTCKNTTEAVNMIKQLPQCWSYNFSIGDAEGHAVIVEQSPTTVNIRKSDGMLCCTNHFQRPDMSGFNREHLRNSHERLQYLSKSQLNHMDMKEVFNAFRENTPLYNEAYRDFFGTLHTFAYSFRDQKVFTAVPGGDVLEIDFNEWVRGKNLDQDELIGHLHDD